MRKIFSSQRVETVEGVAKLLRDADIEVRVSNGRSYKGHRSGQFSYMDAGNTQNHPTVWVVHANDQHRARELLRSARLLDTTRRDLPNVEYAFADTQAAGNGASANWGWRIRIALLLVIGAIAMFIVMRHRSPAPAKQPAPAPVQQQPAPQTPPTQDDDDSVRVRIQP